MGAAAHPSDPVLVGLYSGSCKDDHQRRPAELKVIEKSRDLGRACNRPVTPYGTVDGKTTIYNWRLLCQDMLIFLQLFHDVANQYGAPLEVQVY